MQTVLVTGATGKIGRQLVAQLCAANVGVCAMTRNPESAALPSQAGVVRGDLTDPATLDACVDGVDAVFLMWQTPVFPDVSVESRLAREEPGTNP
jgi:uncharacterized protein YbjT (DUF2867 family)